MGDNVCSSETAFDVIERVNQHAHELVSRCERLAEHLCGPYIGDAECFGDDVPMGVFPSIENRARYLNSALYRADRALERIAEMAPPMPKAAVSVPSGPRSR